MINPLLEKMIILALKQLLTPDVVKGAEVELINFLKELASKTDNKIDDVMVDAIAAALGVA